MSPSPALHGLRIAITRPQGQAGELIGRIRAAGGEAIALPLLEIAGPEQELSAEELARRLQAAGLVVFISPNAVRMACRLLPAAHWPRVPLACIGQGTARALREAGLGEPLVPPAGADSEALLALPELASLEGRRVLIVRGEGGRELLADTLARRGARVEHAVVYRRLPILPDLRALRRLGEVIFVITSSEALQVLMAAACAQNEADWLRAQGFVFGHPRIARTGSTLGLLHGIIVESPAEDALFEALLGLAKTQENRHDGRSQHR